MSGQMPLPTTGVKIRKLDRTNGTIPRSDVLPPDVDDFLTRELQRGKLEVERLMREHMR